MLTVNRFEEGTCAFCSKDREGFSVTMDGSELFLCKPDFIRTVKMRSTVQPRVEPDTPLFEQSRSAALLGNGLNPPIERSDVV